MSLRRAATLLLAVAQVTTGVYLLVYLFRWQWNRAVISGVLFVATEILLVGRLVLRRLDAIEGRLDAQATAEASVRDRLAETRPAPADRFRWLRDTSRTNVFLPVLLGAGVLASAATWMIESLARRTARPTLERSLAGSLQALAFPADGFLEATPTPAAPRRQAWWVRASLVAACVVIITGTGVVVDVVADATQSRPDQLDAEVTTLVELRFRGERAVADPARHANDLMSFCTSESFGREVPVAAVVELGRGSARVVLAGDLGAHGATRLRGCLEDATLERIQADVSSITEVGATP